MAEPPFDAGAVHDTCAEAFPETADTSVGCPGAALLTMNVREAWVAAA